MPLCGVTKQRNSLICCNILAETPVKTHFHKRSGELDLLKPQQACFLQKQTREVSSTQPLCASRFHAGACFCSPTERRYHHRSFSKLLCTWQFIFCMISQKPIRSCKDKYQIAPANWCSLGGTPLIMLSWLGSGELRVDPESRRALIKSLDDLGMNLKPKVASLRRAVLVLEAQGSNWRNPYWYEDVFAE